MKRLVVVSNRVAPPGKSQKTQTGGLAVAVLAALRESGGLWFGWSGKVADTPPDAPAVVSADGLTYATVDLSQRDYEEFYLGYSNATLWPLFHYRLDLTDFRRRNYAGYLRTNAWLARKLAPLLRPDDLVWVHDYHLLTLAEELRQLDCRQPFGFFLHTPFPSVQILIALPGHTRLMRALFAFDLVGFQTEIDRGNFLDYVRDELGGTVHDRDRVSAFGRTLRVEVFPIGIDVDAYARMAQRAWNARPTARLRDSLAERALILGVDRLDYTKGLLQRFEAYQELLIKYPGNRGRVTFLQIAPPTREDVPEYMEIRLALETAAGHINGQFAEFDWVPLRYLHKAVASATLAGFQRLARIGLVTPLRDGMNLVAKEYVACQNPEDPGVLVLSRFAGAAHELDSALVVNPFDIEMTCDALETGLSMPLPERRERWQAMIDVLRRHDLTAWRQRFTSTLAALGAQPHAA